MLCDLIILPEAEQDLAQAYLWYERQESGLGTEFLRCIDARIQFIRRSPEMYQVAYEIYRRATVRRFPYVVFYEYTNDTVIIYAVSHSAQDPKGWRGSLS